MTRPDATTITLYLSRQTALAAAERYMERAKYWEAQDLKYRVLSATMRDEDGSVDQGFKVHMQDHHRGVSFYL